MTANSIIVITAENNLQYEVSHWIQLLELGIAQIHVRKPALPTEELLALINDVPANYRKRLVIHSDINAAIQADVGGVHLPYHQMNKNLIPDALKLSVSVHSWEEARKIIRLCAYCFISPIFDSISKNNYAANPALKMVPDDLKGHKIFGLGGVKENNLQKAIDMGYYGVATLGYIWQNETQVVDKAKLLLRLINRKKFTANA